MKLSFEENKPEIKIGQAALYLFSIFNQMKTLALRLEDQAKDEEVKLFLNDLPNFCEIGYGVTNSIYEAASDLDTEITTKTIAEQIAFLIKSEDVPDEISDALAQAVSDLQSDVMNEHEQTPEYIALVLEKYEQKDE